MSKITVSKKQMAAVNLIKRDKLYSLEELINTLVEDGLLIFSNDRSGINNMTTEQIVLAWHGYAEVEPEFVSFDEAKKALEDEKHVTCEFNNKKYEYYMFDGIVFSKNMKRNTGTLIEWYDIWDQIFFGKWSIAGDTNE